MKLNRYLKLSSVPSWVFIIVTIILVTLQITMLSPKTEQWLTPQWSASGSMNADSYQDIPIPPKAKDYWNSEPLLRITLNFEMSGYRSWNNLFQTNEGNDGVRLEIEPSMKANFVFWGDHGHLATIPVNKPFEMGNKYLLKFSYIKRYFYIYIHNLTTGEVIQDGRYIHGDPPLIDSISMGRGYSKDRIFMGKINSYQVETLSYRTIWNWVQFLAWACWLTGLYFFVLRPKMTQTEAETLSNLT